MNKKNPYYIDLLISITLLVAIVMMGVFTIHYTINIHDQDVVDKLRVKIDGWNVSDDYRNGWNDCLDNFEEEWHKTVNMTGNVSELMN